MTTKFLKLLNNPGVTMATFPKWCMYRNVPQSYLQQSRGGHNLNAHQQMMDQEAVKYTHTWILLSHLKKNEIMPSAVTQMDLQITVLNEGSQKEKEKYHTTPLTCGISNMI